MSVIAKVEWDTALENNLWQLYVIMPNMVVEATPTSCSAALYEEWWRCVAHFIT
jgi:hypothetical protein